MASRRGIFWIAIAAVTLAGCTRAHYREAADAQSYAILAEKNQDPRWVIPELDITPDPQSRFFDPHDLDDPPLPPDDPAAHRYMHCVYGMRGWSAWHETGDLAHVENPLWTTYFGGSEYRGVGTPLPELQKLTLADAIRLSLLHSRDYQEQLENVYLSALSLTFDRYLFDVRPIGPLGEPGSALFFQSEPDDRSDLTLGTTSFGLSKLLPTGGQLLAELANDTIWLFSGPNQTGTATTLAYSVVQPLLAGFGREIVLENLTQAERSVLYSLRDFARFRKDFFVTVVTGSRALPLPGSSSGGELAFLIRGARSPTVGYNFLLFRLQRVRNAEANVRRLEARVRELGALVDASRATALDVTQLQSSLASSRSRLLRLRQTYENEQDRYKLQLGLPPDMNIEIDDSLLEPFQFLNPKLSALEDRLYAFVQEIARLRAADNADAVSTAVERLSKIQKQVAERFDDFEDEFRQLDGLLPQRSVILEEEETRQLHEDVAEDRRRFEEARAHFGDTIELLEFLRSQVQGDPSAMNLQNVVDAVSGTREELLGIVQELSGLEITLHVQMITLEPVFRSPGEAVRVALANRLDLMNRRAFVMDTRRRLEIASDELESTLNVVVEGSLRTKPLLQNNNPLELRKGESQFRFGLSVTTPLDRRRERNNFRAAQISYQRARRNYMAAEDQVKLDVRNNLRRAQTLTRVFEIQRRAVRIAARELDQAIEFANRPPQPGQGASAGGQQGVNISRALDNILDAQDDLIDTWVDYQAARLSLMRDLGTMRVDAQGVWDEPAWRERFLNQP